MDHDASRLGDTWLEYPRLNESRLNHTGLRWLDKDRLRLHLRWGSR